MAKKYPPYVNAYGKIADVFNAIKSAAVPTKFNQDFLHTMLGLKSSSYHAMIPLMKNLGFLDSSNQPTQAYKDYRDDHVSGQIMAQQVKTAYDDLFKASEFAYKLNKEQTTSKLKTILGVGDNDTTLPNVVGTFLELVKLAEFDNKTKHSNKKHDGNEEKPPLVNQLTNPIATNQNGDDVKFGISYTINLNLPATTEIEVFNAIFKSLKENLLK
jgi:hypothetical protein